MKTSLIYGIAVIIFFAIDMLWIGVIAKDFYREKLGFIFTGEIRWSPEIMFYILYIGGILFFAVLPAIEDANYLTALLNGAIFGLMCYSTYDLTNMATIKEWPLIVTIADIIWGTVLTGSVSFLTLGQLGTCNGSFWYPD